MCVFLLISSVLFFSTAQSALIGTDEFALEARDGSQNVLFNSKVWDTANTSEDRKISASAAKLQQDLDAAIARGDKSFDIPHGEYDFGSSDFMIRNAQNMHIRGEVTNAPFNGTSSPRPTLWFTIGHGVMVVNCIDTKVEKLTIDYEPPCFSQGVINKITVNPPQLDITVDEGFPLPDSSITPSFNAHVIKAIYWNVTTKLMLRPQKNDFFNSSVHLGGRKYRISLKDGWVPKNNHNVGPGTVLTLSPRKGLTYSVRNCTRLVTRNVFAHGAGNMLYYEGNGMGGNHYDRVYAIRRPNASPFHYMVASADGFHSNNVRNGPTYENSKLEHIGDDFLNIHNKLLPIIQIDASNDTLILGINDMGLDTHIYPGTLLKFFSPHEKEVANSTAKSIHRTYSPSLLKLARDTANRYWKEYHIELAHASWAWKNVAVYIVQLQDKVPSTVKPLDVVEVECGRNSMVRNNVFNNTYASLAKLKASNSQLHNNYYEAPCQGGILLLPQISWMEGNFGLHNISIYNNTLCDCKPYTKIVVDPHSKDITLRGNKDICTPPPSQTNSVTHNSGPAPSVSSARVLVPSVVMLALLVALC